MRPGLLSIQGGYMGMCSLPGTEAAIKPGCVGMPCERWLGCAPNWAAKAGRAVWVGMPMPWTPDMGGFPNASACERRERRSAAPRPDASRSNSCCTCAGSDGCRGGIRVPSEWGPKWSDGLGRRGESSVLSTSLSSPEDGGRFSGSLPIMESMENAFGRFGTGITGAIFAELIVTQWK